jgi:hypothetical protein
MWDAGKEYTAAHKEYDMTKFLALALLLVGGFAVGCKKEEAAPTTPAAPPAEAPAEPAAS